MVFLHDSDSSLLDTRTVGFGEPTKVYPNRKEIIEGAVVLSIDYVKKASRLQRATLYLHEVGHALGLGHAESKSSVMFPIVDSNNDLSPADITGIRALTKVCATQ
jgi:hypothetical protein